MDKDILTQAAELIKNAKCLIAFTGAGISVESGIPSFRGEGGLWSKYNPNVLSLSRFYKETGPAWKDIKEIFYDYWGKSDPNAAHKALAKLETEGLLKAVITMNIDNLHQKAGSKNVYELHGTVHKNHCTKCGKFFDLDYIMNEDNCKSSIPYCPCGGIIKPDVVLYEEALDDLTVNGAVQSIRNADVMIVGGSSLVVYPAAGLINYFKGSHLVLINRSPTPYDSMADLVINNTPIGQVLKLDD